MSKKLSKKFVNKSIKKIRQKISSKYSLKNLVKNLIKQGTPRNQRHVTTKLQRKMVPFSSVQSRFVEAPLVRQADGELKKQLKIYFSNLLLSFSSNLLFGLQ